MTLAGEIRGLQLGRVFGGLCALVLASALAAPASAFEVGLFEAYAGDPIREGFGVAECGTECSLDAERFGVDVYLKEELVSEALPDASGDIPIAGTARLFDIFTLGYDRSFTNLILSEGQVTAMYENVQLPFGEGSGEIPMPESFERVFLYFATNVDGVYAPADVGIEVTDALIETEYMGKPLFYPAMELHGGGTGSAADTFSLNFDLAVDFEFDGSAPIVPDLMVGVAYVVPEPGTFALVGAGLLGLVLLGGGRYSV